MMTIKLQLCKYALWPFFLMSGWIPQCCCFGHNGALLQGLNICVHVAFLEGYMMEHKEAARTLSMVMRASTVERLFSFAKHTG